MEHTDLAEGPEILLRPKQHSMAIPCYPIPITTHRSNYAHVPSLESWKLDPTSLATHSAGHAGQYPHVFHNHMGGSINGDTPKIDGL